MSLEALPILSRAGEKTLARLTARKERGREGLFLAEGLRLVEEALDCGVTVRWAVVAESAGERVLALVRRLSGLGLTVCRCPDRVLRRNLDLVTPQAVAAVCEQPEVSLEKIILGERALVVVCDSLQEPGNLGAIIRVAAAAGADAVLAGPGTVDPWNPKCVRGSMGALFRLAVARIEDSRSLEDFLKVRGFSLFAAAAAGEDVFKIPVFPARTALLVGSEAAGLTGFALALAGRKLAVPMARGVESLNVAVAAGILLYEIVRKAG